LTQKRARLNELKGQLLGIEQDHQKRAENSNAIREMVTEKDEIIVILKDELQ